MILVPFAWKTTLMEINYESFPVLMVCSTILCVDYDILRFFISAYHCKCIDPWLTRNRRVCPVCKRRVLARGEHFSDSESDTEDSETRPLLRPGSYGTQGGTFSQQRDNPLMNQDVAHMESTPVQVEEDEPDAASIEAVVIESQPRY